MLILTLFPLERHINIRSDGWLIAWYITVAHKWRSI